MKFEGVTFNQLFWAGKQLKDFVKHESHHGLTIEQLEEAFYLMNPKVKDGNDKPGAAKDKKDGHSEGD